MVRHDRHILNCFALADGSRIELIRRAGAGFQLRTGMEHAATYLRNDATEQASQPSAGGTEPANWRRSSPGAANVTRR